MAELSEQRHPSDQRWLEAVSLVALLPILFLAVTAAGRLRYPFELHWMEGMTLDHVRRLWQGQPLFVPPSLEFVPSLYPPLYYYLAAPLGTLVGQSFVPLRLLSILATSGTLAVLAALVRRETSSWHAGVLAAGLYAATYPLSGAWMDQGRVDALLMFLLVAAIALLRWNRRIVPSVGAGSLLALACLTKQMGLTISLPILLMLLLQRRMRSLWVIMPWLVLLVGATLWLNQQSAGWYRFYTSGMVGTVHHLIGMTRPTRIVGFWATDILRALAPAVVLSGIYLVWAWRSARSSALFYGAVACGLIGTSWWHRSHVDTDQNGLMPVYLALALLAGMGWGQLVSMLRAWPLSSRRPTAVAVGAMVALWIIGLLYNPATYVPTAADRAAGEALVARLAALDGEIFIPYHSYLAPMAGKPAHAHAIPIGDLLRSGTPPRQYLIDEMSAALATRRFGALILDEGDYLAPMGRDESYHLAEILFEPEDPTFWPRSGTLWRPTTLWLPRP